MLADMCLRCSLQCGSLPDSTPDLIIPLCFFLFFLLLSLVIPPSITLCQLKLLKEGAEWETEKAEQRFWPSTKEWDLLPRLSKRDYDRKNARPRRTRGKRHWGSEEQGGRNRGGIGKREVLVVNSESDKVEREGDRGGEIQLCWGEQKWIKDGGRQIESKGSRGEWKSCWNY